MSQSLGLGVIWRLVGVARFRGRRAHSPYRSQSRSGSWKLITNRKVDDKQGIQIQPKFANDRQAMSAPVLTTLFAAHAMARPVDRSFERVGASYPVRLVLSPVDPAGEHGFACRGRDTQER